MNMQLGEHTMAAAGTTVRWSCAFVTAVPPTDKQGYGRYTASVLAALRTSVADVDVLVFPGRLGLLRAAARFRRLRRYDLVVLNHYQMGRLLLLMRFRRSIYVSQNPEHLTDASLAALKHPGARRAVAHARAWVRRSLLLRVLARATTTTCICEEDARDLSALSGRSTSVVVPTIDVPRLASRPASHGGEALRLGLVGSFVWKPKRANAEWMLETILLPLAREGIALQLTLAGYGADRVRISANAQERLNVTVIGDFDDPATVYNNLDLAIVPERQVGGVKLKTLEAASFGIPIIGSSEAFRGTGLAGIGGVVCATPDEYRAAITAASRTRITQTPSPEIAAALATFTPERAARDVSAVLAKVSGTP